MDMFWYAYFYSVDIFACSLKQNPCTEQAIYCTTHPPFK